MSSTDAESAAGNALRAIGFWRKATLATCSTSAPSDTNPAMTITMKVRAAKIKYLVIVPMVGYSTNYHFYGTK